MHNVSAGNSHLYASVKFCLKYCGESISSSIAEIIILYVSSFYKLSTGM